MKSLKLSHTEAQEILDGTRTSTWRINDDKDLHVNDQVTLVDKVGVDPASWVPIGTATILTVFEKQLAAVTPNDVDGNKEYKSLEDIITEYQSYYGPQVGPQTPVKIIHFSFTAGTEVAMPAPNQAQLYADGGSRGNPGPSASGYVLMNMDGNVIVQNGLALGVTTNNQAEYQSLKLGLEEALRRGIRSLKVYMDSMLVVNQMRGVYKVKNADLKAINQSVMSLVAQFESITFTHVPRERNRKADAIVNEILDAASK